mgnify:CR=1 FL=1
MSTCASWGTNRGHRRQEIVSLLHGVSDSLNFRHSDMADVDIPQEEADELIAMEKRYTGPDTVDYPGGGEKLKMKGESPDGAERFDQSRTVLLLEDQSPTSVLGALREGRSYVQYDGDGVAPAIQSVDAEDGCVRLDAPDAGTIRWITAGETVAEGPEIALGEVTGRYVRAEATADGGAVSCTQPLYLD